MNKVLILSLLVASSVSFADDSSPGYFSQCFLVVKTDQGKKVGPFVMIKNDSGGITYEARAAEYVSQIQHNSGKFIRTDASDLERQIADRRETEGQMAYAQDRISAMERFEKQQAAQMDELLKKKAEMEMFHRQNIIDQVIEPRIAQLKSKKFSYPNSEDARIASNARRAFIKVILLAPGASGTSSSMEDEHPDFLERWQGLNTEKLIFNHVVEPETNRFLLQPDASMKPRAKIVCAPVA